MLLHLRRTSKLSLRLFSTTFPAPSTPSTVAVETRYTHLPSSSQTLSSVIAPIFSTNTSDTKQAFQSVKRKYIEKYQNHKLDVGSSQIQVAILTEKIRLLAAHLQEHKKDKSAFRGFNTLIYKRRRMMLHLKKTNFEAYKRIVVDFELYQDAAAIIANKH